MGDDSNGHLPPSGGTTSPGYRRPRAPSAPVRPPGRPRGLSSSSLVWDGYEPDPAPLPDDVYPRVIPNRHRTLGYYIALIPIIGIWAITPAS